VQLEEWSNKKGELTLRKAIVIVIALCLTGLVQAQEQRQPREVWNEVFTKRHGRNALFLATQGWEVTGFDISDVGVHLAREAGRKRGLRPKTLVTSR
jgi:hypothetical protein